MKKLLVSLSAFTLVGISGAASAQAVPALVSQTLQAVPASSYTQFIAADEDATPTDQDHDQATTKGDDDQNANTNDDQDNDQDANDQNSDQNSNDQEDQNSKNGNDDSDDY